MGSQGTQGIQGRQGITGATGAQGTIGTSVTGAQGTQGTSGAATALPLSGGTMTGTFRITNNSIRSAAASNWDGDPGAEGKIQYHANRWYIVSDSSSDRIVQFRRNGTDVSYIDNSGNFQGNAATAYGLNVHAGRNNEANKVVRTDGNGYIQAGWINTDSGDNGATAISRVYASQDGYIRYYTPANFATAAKLVTQMDGTRDGTNYNSRLTSGFYNAENSPANSVGTGFSQLIVAKGLDTGWQLAGGYANNTIYTRGWHSSGTFYQWYTLLSDGNYNSYSPTLTGGNASGTWGISVTGNAANITAYTINQSVGTGNNVTFNIADATQFRDSNDTSYYLNPNGDSSLSSAKFWGNQIIIRGGSPTLYFQDSDQMSAMLHNNSNLLYILRGGVDTTSWSQVGGYWPVYWDLSNNNATFGGAIWAAGNVTAYSDAKLKENVETVTSALDKTLSLRGVYYTLIRDETKTRKMGVIAQEVQKVVPEVVMLHQDKEDTEGTLSVDYGNITALLIEAIKEQQKQIDELKALIKK
jgi:hypothetical protein